MNENIFKRGYCDEYLNNIRSKVSRCELDRSDVTRDERRSLFIQDVEKYNIDYNTWNDSTRENIMTYVDNLFAMITDIVNIVEKHVNKGKSLCIKLNASLFVELGASYGTNLPPIIVEAPVIGSIFPEICILFDWFTIQYSPNNSRDKDTMILNVFGNVDNEIIDSVMYILLNENHVTKNRVIIRDDGSEAISDLPDDNIIKKIVNDIMEKFN